MKITRTHFLRAGTWLRRTRGSQAVAILGLTLLSACTAVNGSGIPDTFETTVTTFRELQIDVQGNVEVSRGSDHTLQIIADDNLIEYFKTSSSDDRLRIYHAPGIVLDPETPIRILVTVAELHTIENNGSATVQVDQLTHNDIEAVVNGSGSVLVDTADALDATCKINGSGDMQVNGLDVDELHVTVNGSGDWQGNGISEELFLTINSSGSFLGFNAIVQRAEVEVNGSGDVEVNTALGLNATINGSGHVRYRGRPQVDIEINGSGTVQED